MRYHAIPQTVFFRNAGRTTPRISWKVVNVDAGHNERHFPRETVASTTDEAIARRIADMLNGTNLHADHWKNSYQSLFDSTSKITARAERAEAEAATWKAQAHLDRDLHITGADILKDTLQERDRLRAQLFEAREQRDEARADARNAWAELKKQPRGFFVNASAECANEHGTAELVSDILKRVQRAEAGEIKMRLEAARALTEVDALRKQRDEHKCAPAYAPTPPHDHVVISLAGYNNLVKERDEALAKYQACVDTVSFVDGQWVKTS